MRHPGHGHSLTLTCARPNKNFFSNSSIESGTERFRFKSFPISKGSGLKSGIRRISLKSWGVFPYSVGACRTQRILFSIAVAKVDSTAANRCKYPLSFTGKHTHLKRGLGNLSSRFCCVIVTQFQKVQILFHDSLGAICTCVGI
jgi:hypothetical protein